MYDPSYDQLPVLFTAITSPVLAFKLLIEVVRMWRYRRGMVTLELAIEIIGDGIDLKPAEGLTVRWQVSRDKVDHIEAILAGRES